MALHAHRRTRSSLPGAPGGRRCATGRDHRLPRRVGPGRAGIDAHRAVSPGPVTGCVTIRATGTGHAGGHTIWHTIWHCRGRRPAGTGEGDDVVTDALCCPQG